MTATNNLPLIVREQGGALVEILTDIDRYIEGDELSATSRLSIARLVQLKPELNNAPRVEMLVYLYTYFGLSASLQVQNLIKVYDVETVFVAVAFIHEANPLAYEERRMSQQDRERATEKLIEHVCELIAILKAMSAEGLDTAEDLAYFLEFLGGLSEVVGMSEEEVNRRYAAAVRSQDPLSDLLPEEYDDEELFEEIEEEES